MIRMEVSKIPKYRNISKAERILIAQWIDDNVLAEVGKHTETELETNLIGAMVTRYALLSYIEADPNWDKERELRTNNRVELANHMGYLDLLRNEVQVVDYMFKEAGFKADKGVPSKL